MGHIIGGIVDTIIGGIILAAFLGWLYRSCTGRQRAYKARTKAQRRANRSRHVTTAGAKRPPACEHGAPGTLPSPPYGGKGAHRVH